MAYLIETFGLTTPLWEIVLRSSAAFLGLVALVRLVPKRNAGHISPNDMLILIVTGTIAADAITGDTASAGDLLLMTMLVLLWGYLLDVLEYRVPAFRRLMRHKQTALIEDGRFLRRNMRREMVTEEELIATLRKAGIADISEVASACLEADGEISVLKKSPAGTPTVSPSG